MLQKLRRRLSIFFFYTARPTLLNPLAWCRWVYEGYAKSRLRAEEALWEHIETALRESSSTGCEYSDYWNLFRQVRERRPANVLECGSGISTIVIAYALALNRQDGAGLSCFLSFEESPFYFEQISHLIPNELRDIVTLELSDRVEDDFDGHRGSSYLASPEWAVDFMYIDGPTDRRVWGDMSQPKCFNADILKVKKSDDFIAILDQRIWTLERLKILMPDFCIRYNPFKKLSFIEPSKSC